MSEPSPVRLTELDDLERRVLLRMLNDPEAEVLAIKYYAHEALLKLRELLSQDSDDP